MKKKKKRIKIKKFRVFTLVALLLAIIFLINTNNYRVISIQESNNKIIVKLNKRNVECILSNDEPTLSDQWKAVEKKICELDYKDGIYNLYIKKNDKIINLSKNKVLFLKTNNNELYITTNSKEKYIKTLIGNINKLKIKNENSDIAILNNEGYIETKDEGTGIINYKYNKTDYSLKIISTNLITEKPKEFDFNKEVISCNNYTDKDSELLDKILKSKIDIAGYKTRAGVVEAARFLTLDFPYKIPYFYENGRQTTNKIDGEGRYYHVGLYLSENKYDEINGSTSKPASWGCSLYSDPIKKYSKNGLDCSGFVSWAILNGGFDIKDVGAGFREGEHNDLTDYGDLKKVSSSTLNNNTIKPGDLLHSEHSGGHIAMIIGIDEEYYYVAQALWTSASSTLTNRKTNDDTVQITKYTKKELIKAFSEIILMDDYYKEDGNLTNMWY